MGGTGPGAIDETRSLPRTAVIALPWLVAAGLAAAGVLGMGRPATSPSTAPTPTSAAPGGAPSATPAAGAPASPDRPAATADPEPSTPVATAGGVATGLPEAVQIGVLAAARASLGTAGLGAAEDATADSWALDLRIGAVEPVTDRFAVVTVTGLVIEHDGGRWSGPHARAVAVPLRTTDDGPLVAGAAWPLTPPVDRSTEPAAEPIDEPDPALLAVLEGAGWAVDEVTAVGLVDGELLRVELSGVAPQQDGSSAPHVLWMLDVPGGPRLLPLEPPDPSSPDHHQENP